MIFKYKNVFYQDVNNFCNDYGGLNTRYSGARSIMVNTVFPNSAHLVIPGYSSKNYERIPKEWKNGEQDLSDLHGAAYLLGQRKKPTGPHLLLVSQRELKQAAATAIIKSSCIRKQLGINKSHVPRKRPAKILGRLQETAKETSSETGINECHSNTN